jgi:lauroyl/myristoyl acyltransferase
VDANLLGLKSATRFVPLLSRKACYRLALLLGSFGASLDRRGRRVALSNLRVAFGDEISSGRRAQIVRESYQHFARTSVSICLRKSARSADRSAAKHTMAPKNNHATAMVQRETQAVELFILSLATT